MSACSIGDEGVVLDRCCIESEHPIDDVAKIKAIHFRDKEIMGIIVSYSPLTSSILWVHTVRRDCIAHIPPRSGNTGNNTIVMPNYRRVPGSDIRQQIIRWKGQKNLSPETGLLCNSEKNSRSGKMPAHIGLGRISGPLTAAPKPRQSEYLPHLSDQGQRTLQRG